MALQATRVAERRESVCYNGRYFIIIDRDLRVLDKSGQIHVHTARHIWVFFIGFRCPEAAWVHQITTFQELNIIRCQRWVHRLKLNRRRVPQSDKIPRAALGGAAGAAPLALSVRKHQLRSICAVHLHQCCRRSDVAVWLDQNQTTTFFVLRHLMDNLQ